MSHRAQQMGGQHPAELCPGPLPPEVLHQLLLEMGIKQESLLLQSAGPEGRPKDRSLTAHQPATGGGVDLQMPSPSLPDALSNVLIQPASAPGPRVDEASNFASPLDAPDDSGSLLSALNLAASIALRQEALARTPHAAVDTLRQVLLSPRTLQKAAKATPQPGTPVAEVMARPRVQLASSRESSVWTLQDALLRQQVPPSAPQQTIDPGSLYPHLVQSGASGAGELPAGHTQPASSSSHWGTEQQVDQSGHTWGRHGVPQGSLRQAAHSLLVTMARGVSSADAPTEGAPEELTRRMAVRRPMVPSALPLASLQNDASFGGASGPPRFRGESESLGPDRVAPKNEPLTKRGQPTCSVPGLSLPTSVVPAFSKPSSSVPSFGDPAAKVAVETSRKLPVSLSPEAVAESDSQWLDTFALDLSLLTGEEGGLEGEENDDLNGALTPGEGQQGFDGSSGGIKRRSAVEKKRRKRISDGMRKLKKMTGCHGGDQADILESAARTIGDLRAQLRDFKTLLSFPGDRNSA